MSKTPVTKYEGDFSAKGLAFFSQAQPVNIILAFGLSLLILLAICLDFFSASCVTGLILENTVTYWSLFGQIVILALIQLGGLGYMTIATVFYRLIIRKHGLREKVIMAETINTTRLNNFSGLIKKIILGTFLFEGVGAALLSISFILYLSPHLGFWGNT